MVYRGGCGSRLDDEYASPSVTMSDRGRHDHEHRGRSDEMAHFVGLDVSVKRSLQRHVTPLKVVSAHRRQLDITPAGPYNHLLVQGNVNEIVLDDAQGLADQLAALFAVKLDLNPP